MAYNYGAPPGAFGRQPNYGFPGAPPGAAPGMAPPPGFDAPPGTIAQSPAGQQAFQVPNIPGVNFNASVIRLGVDQKPGNPADRIAGGRNEGPRGSNNEPLGGRGRPGLGAEGGGRSVERERAMIRENIIASQPPTREELARTIFVGGIEEDAPDDEALEDILRCAGKLRRWTRARDADDKKCEFGFAEYEDVDSLEAANEIFTEHGIDVPVFKGGKVKREEKEDGSKEVVKMNLRVIVDEQSQKYIEEWTSKRKEDDQALEFRLDACRGDLQQCLATMTNANALAANATTNGDTDGDTEMAEANGETQNGDSNEAVVSIPLSGPEDELGDIPEEMRSTVAAEIKAFRDRSNRRDLERMRKEEEMEQAERQRALGARATRLASPSRGGPPSGPASATNGIPLGPRDRAPGLAGAPSGPKGFRGAQVPSDYANSVSFVGGTGPHIKREDEDAPESDEELEARRHRQQEEELEKQYLEQERRWLNRERVSANSRQRDRRAEEEVAEKKQREKDALAKRLRDWNDDEENRLGREEYYVDRSAWLRKRATYRDTEQRNDDANRSRELKDATSRQQADAFLDEMSEHMAATAAATAPKPLSSRAPATPATNNNFKLSLGPAAAKTRAPAAPAPRKPLPDVEGLLEDEEDAAASGRSKPLKPLSDTSTLPTSGLDLSDSERASARAQLASEIPASASELFKHPVRWDSLSERAVEEQVRPVVEKKVLEYLGVQEEMLVETVVEGIKGRRAPGEIAQELEPALEEEASVLMRKVWRLVVFLSESEGRGLN